MKSQFKTPAKYADILKKIADQTKAIGERKPLHFRKVMKENRSFINSLSPYGLTNDGLERKNPLIVALGDSVTAGHFEFNGDMKEFFLKSDKEKIKEEDIIEIIDVRESYLEKFRTMLIEKYEQTAVNTINSGIAGDTMYGMQKRLNRDVICYQPDLVLINGSLNWGTECGDSNAYAKVLKEVIESVKQNTESDIILMTPNMELPGLFPNPKSTLSERVQIIRELAEAENVCLADIYKIWEEYYAQGYPINELLANSFNHPSSIGHEICATTLMEFMKE